MCRYLVHMSTRVETWKDIPGFLLHEISDHGNIRNKKTKRLIKLHKKKDGYVHVGLNRPKLPQVKRLVHRLVALTFLPNPDDLPEVNHKNHTEDYNWVENLEWSSKKSNRDHRRQNKVQAGSRRPVWKCDMTTGEKIEKFKSGVDAAKAIGDKAFTALCKAMKKQPTLYKGFRWIYDAEEEFVNEMWKPILPHFVNGVQNYSISSEGRIKNPRGVIRRGYDHSSGYKRVSIGDTDFCVHRLVAQAFLPNFFGKTRVNHKDGDKSNPKLFNVVWATDSENTQHAHDTGLNTTSRPVQQISLDGQKIVQFTSIAAAGRATGYLECNIWSAATNNTISGDYRWRFGTDTGVLEKLAGRSRPVRQMTMQGEKIADFAMISKAAAKIGVDRSNLRHHMNKSGICQGYKWMYL